MHFARLQEILSASILQVVIGTSLLVLVGNSTRCPAQQIRNVPDALPAEGTPVKPDPNTAQSAKPDSKESVIANSQSATKSTTTPATDAKNAKCIPVAEAARLPDTDVCVAAHVYSVVELPDGTRFLDVCAENLSDEQCRFTILCPPADRAELGDLAHYRDQNIQVRGIVRSMHGRMGIVLSHVRQFNGGPEKFRPNPRLLHGFNGQADRMPVHDPNLRNAGHHRSFMNTRETENLPAKK